jgi:hypothetical protein
VTVRASDCGCVRKLSAREALLSAQRC